MKHSRRHRVKVRIKWVRLLGILLQVLCLNSLICNVLASWCDLDTGRTTIPDASGTPRSVYISVSRDGGVWLRMGVDFRSNDWTFDSEFRQDYHVEIMSKNDIDTLKNFNYTEVCVLSDMQLKIRMEYGWHPSFMKTFNPRLKTVNIVAFKLKKNCRMNTTLWLADNKQGFRCNGGPENVCGQGELPVPGQISSTTFLRHMTFSPENEDAVICQEPRSRNSFTLLGSYYFAYAKLASCPPVADSRQLGYVPKMRAHSDIINNTVLIPDPTQTALSQGTIIGWRVYAKVTSWEHSVYLQVWRPRDRAANSYHLVDHVEFMPEVLRFQEVPTKYLSLSKNDVLGLYFPKHNPLGYSTVPCASSNQRYLYMENPGPMSSGKTIHFQRAAKGPDACRQYSFVAILANKSSSRLVDDWSCPNKVHNADTQKRSDTASRTDTNKAKVVPVITKSRPDDMEDDMAVSTTYIFLIIGCMLAIMIIIGVVSYYRAIRS